MTIWLINVNVAKFLKNLFRHTVPSLHLNTSLKKYMSVTAAQIVAGACSKRCQTMNYDDWTDEELRMLWHIQGLNRMQLDEYLGGLEKNGNL